MLVFGTDRPRFGKCTRLLPVAISCAANSPAAPGWPEDWPMPLPTRQPRSTRLWGRTGKLVRRAPRLEPLDDFGMRNNPTGREIRLGFGIKSRFLRFVGRDIE